MTNYDEKKLLLSIKIIPLILFSIIIILGISSALFLNKKNFNKEIQKVQDTYLTQEKELLKQEVFKVHQNILNEKKLTKEKLKENIKEKVYIAHDIATNIYVTYKDTKSSKEIKKLIKDALVKIRFNNGRGYFFIYSLDYECILLPVARKLEGKSFYNFQDGKGMYLTQKIVQQIKKEKEGFLSWWYHKPNDMKKQYEKIGFNKHFEPFGWFIGTGEYVKDFEEKVQQSITKRLSTYSYGDSSYIFIFNKDGITLTHKDPKEIGKNKLDFKDKNGKYITQRILQTANEGGGFVQYTLLKEKTREETNKISYVMKFNDWNWTIGSGFFTDDLESIIKNKKIELTNKNQEELDIIILVSFILIICIIIFSLLVSYTIQKRFENYKEKVYQKDKMITEQSKLAAMGEMIGNIAHQWRQPLSIISTGATGMQAQKDFGLLSDEQFNKTCETINTNAQYLSRTIDDFKNFIKGDRTKQLFYLDECIKSFINLVEGSIKSHNIQLILELDSSIQINGYSNELIQCFINIFNNAKDALKEIEEDKIIIISTHLDSKNAIIKIIDNGQGIPKNILNNIFEPYFTTKHKSQGTGLGLNMTYKFIVNGMNGSIVAVNKKFEYKNKNYYGAEFTILLPL